MQHSDFNGLKISDLMVVKQSILPIYKRNKKSILICYLFILSNILIILIIIILELNKLRVCMLFPVLVCPCSAASDTAQLLLNILFWPYPHIHNNKQAPRPYIYIVLRSEERRVGKE